MTDLVPLLVRASAGTGKTYALAGRLLTVLLAGAEIESVLATTFTRKAAGEILDRILLTLARAAEDPQQLAALRAQTGREDLGGDQCRMLLHRLIREIHRLKVCTIDSLFSQLARSFPFELHLPPAWRLSDEIEEVWMRRRALDALLAELDVQELASLLSMLAKGETARSVDNELQGLIVDAYSDARWCDAAAWQTLEVPHPPEAAELGRAVLHLAAAQIGHRSADKVLQQIGQDLEARRWHMLTDKKPIQDVADLAPGDTMAYYRKEIPPDLIAALRSAHLGMRSDMLRLLKLQTEATGRILESYGRHAEWIKQQQRVLGFDDVAFRLAKWIGSIDLDELAGRMDGAIGHLLLDEFQDTAPAQWAVLRPLAQRAAIDPPRTSFFCVGDTKQAIYGWRGGRAAIFDAVAREIPSVQQATQDLSYRSSPVITRFVTTLFQNIDRHPKFADSDPRARGKEDFEAASVRQFAAAFPQHASAKETLPGFVRLSTGSAAGGDQGATSNQRRMDRLKYTAASIAELAAEAPQHSVGVLTRTNRTVAQLIFLLKRLGVDVSQEGGNPLTDSALVEVMLSALSLAEHPGDLRWAYHVSHSPLAGLLEIEPMVPRTPAERRDAAIELASKRVRDHLEYYGLTKTLIWLADALIPIASGADATRLRQLVSLAHAYQMNRQPRISSFVDLVRLKRVQRPRPAQVRVMTVHQAKGLEFDSVVLPELSGSLTRMSRKVVTRSASPTDPPEAILRYVAAEQWSLLPEPWRQVFGENAANLMTEALCLLYVAVTRPRHALHMIVDPAQRMPVMTRSPAALIYHALQCEAEMTEPETELYREGNPRWFASLTG